MCTTQFRYATAFDLLLMFIGTIAAMAHGATLPTVMLFFGEATDAFINQDASDTLASRSNGMAVACGSEFVASSAGVSISNASEAIRDNIATGSVNCGALAFGTSFEDILQHCFSDESECLDEDDFIDTINMQAYFFVGIGVATLFVATIQVSFFQVACERQVHKIRRLFYQSILHQEIGWFDANPSGELSSRLSE